MQVLQPSNDESLKFGLFRVRSPLLAESLIVFSSSDYLDVSVHRVVVFRRLFFKQPGCPIRTSADQRLFAPPRSFSQLTTSFVISESLGIPRTPLFASYSYSTPKSWTFPRKLIMSFNIFISPQTLFSNIPKIIISQIFLEISCFIPLRSVISRYSRKGRNYFINDTYGAATIFKIIAA